jgi:hypothetical protein
MLRAHGEHVLPALGRRLEPIHVVADAFIRVRRGN